MLGVDSKMMSEHQINHRFRVLYPASPCPIPTYTVSRHGWYFEPAILGVCCDAASGPDSADRATSIELREVFDSFDLNKSGTIDKSELRQALRDLGIFCTDEELHEMFSVIDSSGDGDLDYGE
eukprot:1201643-Rhodomonas_salina.4